MTRDESSDEETQRTEGRSRSRDRGGQSRDSTQPRGRAQGRNVSNPFRSPRRRQPPPVDEWLPLRSGLYTTVANRGPTAAPMTVPASTPTQTEAETAAAVDASTIPLPGDDGPSNVQEDEDMGSGDNAGRIPQVWNAPAIPQPPTFAGSTKGERRAFMRAYQKYVGKINALQCVGSRPFAMPVSACTEPFSKRRIALFDFNRDHNTITEDEWVAWFMAAFDEDPQDLEVLKQRLQRAIRYDTKILDAESRVGRMLDELMRSLEQDHQEWVLHQEGKMVVDVMTKSIKPESLKNAVQKQLQLQRNKVLKNDVFRFVNWLRTFAAGHQLYVGLEEEPKTAAQKAVEVSQGGKPQSARRDGGRHGVTKDTAGGSSGASRETNQKGRTEVSRPKGADVKPAKTSCLKCFDTNHRVLQCPKCAPGEAEQLLAAKRKRWQDGNDRVMLLTPRRQKTERSALLEGKVRIDNVLLDSGSSVTVVTRGVVDAMTSAGCDVTITSHEIPQQAYPYGQDSKPLVLTRSVRFNDVTMDTTCGPLVLRGLRAWIDDTSPAQELIVSKSVMELLGFSVEELLVGARNKKREWDVSSVPTESGMTQIKRLIAEKLNPPDLDPEDGMECATPEVYVKTPGEDDEGRVRARQEIVRAILTAKVDEAEAQGLEPAARERLANLLYKHVDVFRIDLGGDPPVKIEPLKVRIKPGSTPVKCGMRRYPPLHVEYMRNHVAALESNGMVYKNNRATWAAAPRIVPKKEAGDLRMTIDSRPINACTEPMPWPMPNLDSAMVCLVGTTTYFTLDWTKGYWQLPLHADSQMYFSFMTPFGVYTPTRVLMGQTDAVAYCQSVVHQMFGELLFRGLLAWLDDLLGSARTVDELFDLLDQVLTICARFGLKLSPKKCYFFLREAEWCGKLISAAGITHSPSRIQGLVELSPPATAADLQQFVCATNWMRASIPAYNQLVDPLRRLLDVATKAAGSCKKTALARIALSAVGWSADHLKCFDDMKHALAHVVPLSHPRDDLLVCVFTDASDLFWGAVATQVQPGDLNLPFDEQRHQPLAFISGSFTGASLRWPIMEKEAYAVVESCKRLDYLVVRPGGFRLFTDHRNLVYIFNPSGSNSNMAKYQADKLQRWSLVMSTFPYTIECVSGDVNVWGDLLSRWGSAPPDRPVAHVRKLIHVVSPLQHKDFTWPTAATITEVQRSMIEGGEDTPTGVAFDNDTHFYVDRNGRIWIPDGAVDLQQRLCVIAHQGASGHRRIAATTKAVADKFMWKTLVTDVEAFVRACLHCMCVDGEMVPRPLGSALHAEKPNELIHFDWLSMPKSKSGLKHVLVVKDDMSGFVQLYATESADATTTAQNLMSWFTTFGCVDTWVSDGGSHFKNEVVEKVRKMVGAHHHITAYSPWANGTVEVVNRLVLRAVKALLSEWKLNADEWPHVLPLVQGALNHQPADRLGGIAPVTAFTGLPAKTPMTGFVHPTTKDVHAVEWLDDERQKHVAELHVALEAMHRDVVVRSGKLRRQARGRRDKKKGVHLAGFSVGDFVLVGSVVQRPTKLALRWRGPCQVTRVITDHVMETQQLVPPFEVTTHHACRLKMYHEGGRELTEDLEAQMAFGDGGFHVERLGGARCENGQHQVLVKWLGLEEEESSWEPAINLLEDIPVVFRKWIEENKEDSDVAVLMKSLDLS